MIGDGDLPRILGHISLDVVSQLLYDGEQKVSDTIRPHELHNVLVQSTGDTSTWAGRCRDNRTERPHC